MDENEQCHGVGDLARAMGWTPGGWKDQLMHLIAKADIQKRIGLSYGFPGEVALYDWWVTEVPTPTVAQVRQAWSNILAAQ